MQCFTQIKPNVVRASCRPHAQRRAVVVPLAHAGHTSQASSQQAAAIAIAASSAFLMGSYAANALGIESMDLLPSSIEKPAALSKYAEEQKQKLADADEVQREGLLERARMEDIPFADLHTAGKRAPIRGKMGLPRGWG